MTLKPISNTSLWSGRVLSGLVVVFLVMDAVVKLIPLDVVLEHSKLLGIPLELTSTLAILTLVSALLYAIPQTSVLGAILLTGYLGGAVFAHLRVSDPLFSHTLFGVYLGIIAWGGLYLRDERLRAILPWRRA